MSLYMKGKIIKIITPNYTFLPVNSKLRQIWKFANECFQTEFVDAYCVMPEPRVRWLLTSAKHFIFSNGWCISCHYYVNETPDKEFPLIVGRGNLISNFLMQYYPTNQAWCFWERVGLTISFWQNIAMQKPFLKNKRYDFEVIESRYRKQWGGYILNKMTFEYAQSVTKIEEKVIKTIYNARQSILFGKDNVWVKKDNPEFDLTMLSYGSEELCELVGLYLLDLLN